MCRALLPVGESQGLGSRWIILAAICLFCGVMVPSTLGAAPSFTLTWTDNSNNESGFRVERSLDGVTFSQLALVGPNVTTYQDLGLAYATQYSYRVCAYNSAGSSANTEVVSGTTPAAPVVTPPPNTVPTIGSISNQSIQANGSTGTLSVVVGDAETAVASLVLTASSSNTALIPQSGLVLGGSGSSRTLTVSPASGLSGTATITVTVSDGTLSASTAFTLTVTAANTAPTISDIANRAISANSTTGSISFTVGDGQTSAAALVVSAASSNTTLVPLSGLVLGGSGADRTLVVTPASNQTGSATITVTVSDGSLTSSDTFLLTVAAVNTAPTISDLTNRSINSNANTGAISFTIGDAQTLSNGLIVTAASSNPTLVPEANIVLGGTTALRTVTVTPAANQAGTATITITVSDGALTASDSFVLTVTAVNTAPTITDIANRTIDAGSSTGTLLFTIGDSQTPASSLVVSASSTHSTLIPLSGIVFGGTGANRTVTVTPAVGQIGSGTVTITVSDGSLTASDSFVVTVNAVNTAPSIGAVSDRTMDAGSTSAPVGFTVGDAETPAANLALSAATSNPTLLPLSGITLGGSGANRTVILAPALFRVGTATVTLTVSDGLLSATSSFVVTVNAVNAAPTISGVADLSIEANRDTGQIAFTVGDAETAAAYLLVTAASSNPSLLPASGIALGGSGTSRTVKLTPAANQTGASTVTLTVNDGSLSSTSVFVLTVNAPVTAPTISDLSDRSINADSGTGPISFQIGHATIPVGSLIVTGTTSNSALVPASALVFAGSDAQRTLTITPAPGQTGSSTITVVVSDGTLSTSESFLLTVNAVNTPPTISAISNQTINANGSSGALAFTVGDSGTAAGSLVVSGSSSNPTLLPNANIVFGGSGSTRAVLVTPAPNQSGSATVTLTVTDGTLSTTTQFVLTVVAVNTAPTVSDLLNRSLPTNGTTGAFPVTIGDAESPVNTLTVTATSSNLVLLPLSNLVFGGSGANRTLTATPAANQTGSSTVTVTVSDGSLSSSTSFVLSVATANASPTISDIANRSINANGTTGAISFTVGDAETSASSLVVSATSSNPALVPVSAIVLAGTGTNRTATITPTSNQTGTTTITLTVSDGTLSEATSFVVSVNALMDAPTITAVSNRSVSMNGSTPAIAFSVDDSQVPAGNLVVTAASSNPALVPVSGLALGGSGSSRTLVVTPTPNQTGTATITLTVSNGTRSTGTSFVVTVEAPNTAPTISSLTPRTIAANSSTGAIPVTIGDAQTPAANLTLFAASSNPTLVPVSNIVLGGSDSARTVSVSPIAGQSGSSIITVTVSDGLLTSSSSFTLTVSVANTAPTITAIADRWMDSNATSVPIGFTVADGQTAAASLTVTGSSSNASLLPVSGLAFNGTGSNRTISLTPAQDEIGTTTVTLTVSDGSLTSSTSFVLTVNRANTAPTISPLLARSTQANTNSGAIEFTVGDAESSANSLTVSGSSSNQTVLPFGNIVFGGTGANRTVTLTPAPNQIGVANVTITVSDGRLSASSTFVLSVTASSTVPKISDISNRTVVVNGNVGIAFTVSDAETAAGSLVVTGSSTNTALIGPGSFAFGGSGGNRTVLITPLADRTGVAVVTLTVSDGKLSSSASFSLTVSPAGNTPTLSRIANRSINANSNTGLINFLVADANTPATSLTVTATSSNLTLIPASGIALGGSGATRTVVVTSAANQFGNALVMLTVSDGTTSSSTSFQVTVLPVNTPPSLSALGDRTISANGVAEVIGLTIDDAETASSLLTVYATSSNTGLVPTTALRVDGTGANRTLSITPTVDQTGTTVITVTVSDGSLTTIRSFTLEVKPRDGAPITIVPPVTGDGGGNPGSGGGDTPSNPGTEQPVATTLAITQQPAHQTVGVGGVATLRVVAVGPAPLSYQWYQGVRGDTSTPIVGATSATLITSALSTSANFWVRVTSVLESVSSQTAIVSVVAGSRVYFGTVGSAGSNGSFALLVRADGTAVFLADAATLPNGAFGTSFAIDPAGSFSFQAAGVGAITGQVAGGTVNGLIAGGLGFVGTQDTTGGATSALAGLYRGSVVYSADGDVWVVAGPSGRVFAALVEGGLYLGGSTTLSSSGAFGLTLRDGRTLSLVISPEGSLSGTVEAGSQSRSIGGLREDVASLGRISNMSVRANAGDGSASLISGFTVSGSGSKSVLIRAVGPTLGLFGVPGVLSDPMISLNRQGGLASAGAMASNDDWVEASVGSSAQAVGAFPLPVGSKDAAMLVDLPAGGYTAQLSGADGGFGAALLELYDTDTLSGPSSARLTNLSIRTVAGSGDNVVITGFNVSGNAPKRFLIRAIGPELAAFGVSGSLPNPVLSLYRSKSGETTEVAKNDDWGTSEAAVTQVSAQVGAFGLTSGSQSAALVVWLEPGTYTAVARSGSDTTGVLIVEAYEVP